MYPQEPVALALSADAGFDASAGSFALSGVDMRLDDSQVTGSLTLASLDAGLPSLRFDFDVDQVDLDRYLAPADDSEGGDAQAVAIPQDELAGLDIDGSLRIGQVTAMGMTLTDAEVGLEVKDKVLRLNPLKASFYGGHYDGDIVLDAAGAVPRLSLNERMESVVFAQLGRDFLGYDQVSGAAYGSLKASGSGSTSDAMLKSLRGGLDLRLDEGALEGIDVWHEIRKALAKVKGQPAPEGGTGRTVFSRLSVDASLAGGVLTLDQLIGELPFLKLQGEGSIDLQTQALDIGLVAGVRSVPELSQDPLAADLEGRQVPFRISGAATQPRIAIDLENLLKGEASRALMDKLGLSGSKKADDGGGDQESGEASTEDMARGLLGGLLGGKNDKKEGEGKKDDDG
jgi:AsmA protein